MHYRLISSFKLIVSSLQYERTLLQEEQGKLLLNLNNQFNAFQKLYKKEIEAFDVNLKSIRLQMKKLHDFRGIVSEDNYFKQFAELKEDYYDGAFLTFLKSLDKPSSFALDFKNFYRYIVTKAISKSLNQHDLVKFIKDNKYNKIKIEENSQTALHYVERVNANFSSMMQQEHVCFFSLFYYQSKLPEVDLDTLNKILTYSSFLCWREDEWLELVLQSTELTPNDFIYLTLFYQITNATGKMNDVVLDFLKDIMPLLENANYSYRFSNDSMTVKWYQPFFDRLLIAAMQSKLLMRLVSSRGDLIEYLKPNELIRHKERIKPRSFPILKMMNEDNIILNNIVDKSDFLENIDLSQHFIRQHEIDETGIVDILEAMVEKKELCIWEYFSLSMTEFMVTHSKKHSSQAEFYLLKGKIINSDEECVEMSSLSDMAKLDGAMDNHLENISCFFNKMKTNSILRIKMLEDASEDISLIRLFAINIKGFLDNAVFPYCIGDERIKRLIGKIDASDQKELIWEEMMQVSLLVESIKKAKHARLTLLYNLSPTFKKTYLTFIEEEKNKKKKQLMGKSIEEIKKSIKDQQQASKVELQSITAKPLTEAFAKPTVSPKSEIDPPLALPESKKIWVLSDDEKMTFECGIRAAMAGCPDMAVKWIQQTEEQAGYFIVDFSQTGDTIRVNGALNQHYWFATLTADKKELFNKNYVFNMLKRYLHEDVSLSMENDVLRVTPKKQRCPYPEDMHKTSFEHVKKHMILSVDKKAGLLTVSKSALDLKKLDPHRSSLPASEVSLSSNKKAQHAAPSVNVSQPMDVCAFIKTLLQETVADQFKDQTFNFLPIKKEKEKYYIKFNLKGAPYLSDNEQKHIDTYIVMKSVVAMLQEVLSEKSATIRPDSLDPMDYRHKKCKIKMDMSQENIDRIEKLSSSELRNKFNYYLQAFKQKVELYEAIYACEKEAQGCYHQKIITLNAPAEKEEVIACKSYQRLTLKKEQLKCLKALFYEVKALNETEASDTCMREGIRASRFICYHRIFDNLSVVFDENNNKTSAIFAKTLRDVFRHGYLELSTEFTNFLETLMAAFINYKKEPSSSAVLFPSKHSCISFDVTQAMHHELAQGIKAFFQAKSNHAIGAATKGARCAAVPRLKTAIKEISEFSSLDESKKQTFILAMASLIGEVDKTTPYGEIYGEMGTHKNNIAEMPVDLMQRLYQAHWSSHAAPALGAKK